MDIKIIPQKLGGEIDAISSKSDVHRLLIAAALSNRETVIYSNVISKDIGATCACITALGAKTKISKNGEISVTPIENINEAPTLDCAESGSTLRFLLPVTCAICDKFSITGSGRLPQRPIDTLINEIKKHGVSFSSQTLPITANGKLMAGRYEIRGDISSQYITGLLLSLPLLSKASDIVLTSKLESTGYVDMTLKTLDLFGIKIERKQNGYHVLGGQKYISPEKIMAEGDFSNAAFFFAANFLMSNVKIHGLNEESAQGDKAIVDILSSLKDGSVIDGSDIPDIVPIISICACGVKGKIVINNISRLRLKESDRIASTKRMIESLGGKIETTENSITVFGSGELTGGTVDSENDHRIAMSAAIASCICKNEVYIKDAQAVEKSYPNFFDDFNKLGGKAYVLNIRE